MDMYFDSGLKPTAHHHEYRRSLFSLLLYPFAALR
jgi:hypothetical protein